MNIFDSIFHSISPNSNGIVAIGFFDAIHQGHQKIFTELKKVAEEKSLEYYVLTFNNHPYKKPNGRKILEIDDKIKLLNQLGVKNLIICEFDEKFYTLKPEDFITLLRKNFNINDFIAGRDFTFGYKKTGTVDLIRDMGGSISIVDSVVVNDRKVSTTIIKECVSTGKVDKARNFLTRPFFIKGLVKRGKQLGRTIGFPTMNIYNDEILYPADGVYFTRTYVNEKPYYSMTYVAAPVIETHLLDYNIFDYNLKIRVDFFTKIRDNMCFKDIDSLKSQLVKDLKLIKNHIKKI